MSLENPVMVTTAEPIDVSGIRDPGMQIVVLLARSLGWNVLQKLNQPVVITAIDGHQRRIPTNTSIRSGVYQGHLSGIITHSEHFVPTPALAEAIIKVTKPNRDQAARLRKAVGDLFEDVTVEAAATEDPEPLSTEEMALFEVEPEPAPSGGSTDLPEGDPEQQPTERYVVSEEPELSAWAQEDHGGSFANRRTWSDGSIDYVCKLGDHASDNIKSVQGHWMWHVRRGEAERIDERVHLAPDDPGRERAVIPLPTDFEVSGRIAIDQVRQIAKILGVSDRRDEIKRLRDEVISLRKENRQLKADWKALRAMLRQGP